MILMFCSVCSLMRGKGACGWLNGVGVLDSWVTVGHHGADSPLYCRAFGLDISLPDIGSNVDLGHFCDLS